MSRDRTVIEKVGDFTTAYDIIRDHITPPAARQLITTMQQLPEQSQAIDVVAYANVVNASMALSRIVSANDRAAAVAAAMITASGVSRPVVSIDDGE